MGVSSLTFRPGGNRRAFPFSRGTGQHVLAMVRGTEVKDKPRDPLMRHVDNAARLRAFRVVEGGVTRKPRVSLIDPRLRRLGQVLLMLAILIFTISVPWFVGLKTIASSIWNFFVNK